MVTPVIAQRAMIEPEFQGHVEPLYVHEMMKRE
jgi:hypothetical protein